MPATSPTSHLGLGSASAKIPKKAKQRGIFSELLSPKGEGEADESFNDNETGLHSYNGDNIKMQPVPSANAFTSTFKSRTSSIEKEAKKVVTTGSNQEFSNLAIEPKVSIPYKTQAGQPPRIIEIQRRKRLYSSVDIQTLLLEKGIDYCAPVNIEKEPWCALPLEAFDDSNFDVYNENTSWLELGMKNGSQNGIPCKAIYRNEQGPGIWMEAKVIGYDATQNKFQIEWKSTKMKDYIHRIELLFDIEDPFRFVERIKSAYESRKEAYAVLRYNLYVDCMPAEGLPMLDSEQMNRVLTNALCTKELKGASLDTTTLLNEINLSYARAMNKIIYDTSGSVIITPPLAVPKKKWLTSGGRYKGTILIPNHNFAEQFSNFSFNTLYTKMPVIHTLIKVQSEMKKLSTYKVFKYNSSKSQKLEDFESTQAKVLKDLLSFLNDSWIVNIKGHIQTELKGSGKGWFNLNEDNTEVYNFSKLKKLFAVVNFMMQDNLRFTVEQSVQTYFTQTLKVVQLSTVVLDTNDVKVTLNNNSSDPDAVKGRTPLFALDIGVEGEGNSQKFVYNTDIQKLIDAPVQTIDIALKAMQKMTHVEYLIMDKLFWSYKPVIGTVHPDEVKDVRENLRIALANNLGSLTKYLATYDKHLKFLRLNVDEYLASVAAKHEDVFTLSPDVQKLVKFHQEESKLINSTIPSSIDVGLALVNPASIKKLLTTKHNLIITSLLKMLNDKNLQSAHNLNKQYADIQHSMEKTPKDIEELTALNEYLTGVDNMLKDGNSLTAKIIDNFDVLEAFKVGTTHAEFSLKWNLIGWNKKVLTKKAEVQEQILVIKADFDNVMSKEQDAFVEQLKALQQEVLELNRFSNIEQVDQVSTYVRTIKDKLKSFENDALVFNQREALFEKPVTEYKQLGQIKKDFEPYSLLWESVDDWIKKYKSWLEAPFTTLDAETINKVADNLFKDLNKAAKYFEKSKIDGCLAIANDIKAKVEAFKPFCPLITALRNPGMQDRHWKQLSKDIGMPLVPDDKLTLSLVFDMKLQDHIEIITKVGETAGKEFQIEKSLKKMKEAWENYNLVIKEYNKTETFVLHGVDDLMALLDEQITMTQAMGFSAFKKQFEKEIEEWDQTLATVSEVVDEWIKVQRNWMYLQPIFDSPDINKQLPQEGKRFSHVDKNWRQELNRAKSHPKAIKFCNSKKLLEKFQESNKFLELVQKGLSDYLETKRAAFSRFYFLSNDELLEILSQTKDPKKVQPHLKKCFEAIKTVKFESDLTITAMNSSEGETIQFTTPVDPKGSNVEVWMNGVEEQMKGSVKKAMYESIMDYTFAGRGDWMQKWPGMCVLNGSQVHWTREIEEGFDNGGNAGVRDCYLRQLKQLEVMVTLVRGKLTDLARTSIGALAVIDVHARDVTKQIVDEGISNKNDFMWISQLRYYWKGGDLKSGNLWAEMVSSKRPYGYEYLGNSFRLVITPLTDKCYLTLMGALQMILGGAPAGPAGTGKTETTKDLAKALAKQCIVFNCSDSMDFKMTGKFFKGLASCGAWACFDEFNRILIEVLSVIAQQIMTLQQAVMNNKKRCMFEDTEISVSDQFAVFITMNPGYAGRTELPDNLKALFRPVAMMVPDYALIGEIMLFAYGFENSRMCSLKMVATFRLCSEQLSSQDHYDYGMRAVKTVITAAGFLKRKDPDMDEELLMLRGLMDVNLPKFLSHDLPLFKGIMGDLFPGKSKPAIDYGDLTRCMKIACESKGLQAIEYFIQKCIQLYEMIVVRHGLMVVGPTMSGKSETFYVLRDALTMVKAENIVGERYEKVELYYLNPKSITMGQLYGEFDANTHEWRDGVIATIIRETARSQNANLKWVLFDGPVDTLWIESMNTVLDDNKKLCLNSGEIVSLSNETTMMFEPKDLAVASPATVSRCGMIYMESVTLGYDVIVVSWSDRLPKCFTAEMKKEIWRMYETYVTGAIAFLRRFLKEPVPTVNNNLIASLLNLLDCYFNPFQEKEGRDPPTKKQIFDLHASLPYLFMFSLVWSIGVTSDVYGRKRMDSYLRGEMESNGFKNPMPTEFSIYDYRYDEELCAWRTWIEYSPEFIFNPQVSFSEIVVPTKDTIRYTYLLDTLVTNDKHVLMTGKTGTGKTVNIQKHLSSGMSEKYAPLMFTFSARTSANQTQDIIDSKTEKRRKGVYGPTVGKQFVIFVDDVNMPQREIFFAQPPIELLRQLLCAGGWYDRATLEWRKIIDYTMVLACGPPGGGRNEVTERFFRHFNIIGYTEMEDQVMFDIFSKILGGYVSNFTEEVQSLTAKIVWSSITIYNNILESLLPTPAKSHYTFNLRDLGKIFQGLLMCDKNRLKTAPQMIRLWAHEEKRVFKDRLINDEDNTWFEDALHKEVVDNFNYAWEDVFINKKIIFGDYMVPGADPKIYDEVNDLNLIVPTCEEYLGDYNAERKPIMNLVLFLNAIEHVSRISRVIRQPSGHALLLGVGGSGRQSLTRLATFMADYALFQVVIAKGYGPTAWREDLKSCLMKAGLDAAPTVFLFTDTQIVFEGMVEDVNNILNSGDVPNLYNAEDLDKIMTVCKPDCMKKNIQPTKLNIFNQYILRVKQNIHVVVCMSPLGEAFRRRLRMFPSLSNCCTIDWFTDWPDEALKTVATAEVTSTDLELGDSMDGVVEFFKIVHQAVAEESKRYLATVRRYNYVTPTSYLEFIATYKKVLKSRRAEISKKMNTLQLGLDKMKTTEEQVQTLQVQIQEMQPILLATQKEVDAMIAQINIDKAAAAITKTKVEKEEADATEKARDSRDLADKVQNDLDRALPALDAAVACLSELEKKDIDEVKNFNNPPNGVKLTCEALCYMFELKVDKDNVDGKKVNNYFKTVKAQKLGNPKFIDELKGFDKDNIPDSVIKKIDDFAENPDFTPEKIKNASTACRALCMWVLAMHTYHYVARDVEPKKIALKAAQESLDITIAALNIAKAELQAVNDKLGLLESNLQIAVDKKDKLASEVQIASSRLVRAGVLTGGLGGEKIRWAKTVKDMGEQLVNLIGDALISSATIAYSGAFTPEFRASLVKRWIESLIKLSIPHTPGTSISTSLADPVAIREWIIAGLPTDNHSVENGIIMSKARRWPLFIDPQGQANRFIKNMGKDTKFAEAGLDIVKLTDGNFLKKIENGVRFGMWILLENIGEEIDAALEPLLQQQKFLQGGTWMIKIGDNTIAYNETFKFFMTTKLPNPHYPPEICVKVSLLNFTITPKGLEDQLLGVAIIEERPELEEKKNVLIVNNAMMKKKLQEIETNILKLLSNSKGNILDDIELIEELDKAKKTSDEVNIKMAEAAVTEKEIDEIRENYREIAYRGSMMYFCISDLSIADPMYQYSLTWFSTLFTNSIRSAEQSDDFKIRLANLIDYFTYSLYNNVCRSLFEKHKLVFSFLMAIKILQGNNLIDAAEYRFLISGLVSTVPDHVPNPNPTWIVDRTWKEILMVSTLPAFQGFVPSFIENISGWNKYFDSENPQTETMPGKWNNLDEMKKLCILRTLRPDKMSDGIQGFVIASIGRRYVEPPTFDLSKCYADSGALTPLIFVLTAGSDPTKTFIAFAKQMKMKYTALSLGQGQDVIAERMIAEGIEKGTWVYLQNCHLYASWMTELERLTGNITPETCHKDFRLWLSSMPSNGFPVSILQNGVKMTMEPPKGLRANLKNAYYKLDDSSLSVTTKPEVYMKLLFALSFFHANVQDRRKYGALGWNRPYDFNETDLEISRQQTELFLDLYEEIPYKVLNILVSYINYGGRVTDYIDLRTIDVILRELFCPDILLDDYKFSASGLYYSVPINNVAPHKGYMEYIETLPINPEPEVFGMHSNANITCAQNETWEMFDTILALQPRSATGAGKSREDVIYDLACSIEDRLPQAFNIESISMKWPLKYEQSMNTVLLQECLRFNGLIDEMWRTLPTLKKALKGLVVMSGELDAMANSMFSNWVPQAWEAKAYPSLKPLGAWIQELLDRIKFIQTWYDEGVPATFWISGFYFPQAFITGTLQNYARKYKLPIDTLENDCLIRKENWQDIKEAATDGCYIRGLFLEGARWDPEIGSLNDSRPKELFTDMAVIHLMPVMNRKEPTEGVYRCPVYKILSRWGVLATTGHSSNFVLWLEIPSNRRNFINNTNQADQDTWIKAGVAAFCSLRY